MIELLVFSPLSLKVGQKPDLPKSKNSIIFKIKKILRTKIKKSSLLVFSPCLCGHFEPTPTKFAPSNPKLYRPDHDICPKIIFGIFRSKLGKNQKKNFSNSYHIEVYKKAIKP
jgi:hypothetical protein